MEKQVHLICPDCGKDTSVNGDRFRGSKFNVWCNGCQHRFQINLETGQNCKVTGNGGNKIQINHLLFDTGLAKWSVRTDQCKGFSYDLKGLATLIRTGLISQRTPIRPPHSERSYKAGELAQLHKFFVDKEERASRPHPGTKKATVPEEDETDRSWKDMDVGELFKTVLRKDLFTRG